MVIFPYLHTLGPHNRMVGPDVERPVRSHTAQTRLPLLFPPPVNTEVFTVFTAESTEGEQSWAAY